ncbi:MAG: monovalent cation/H(+) antiporter subunit G [Alphaproteobacteria bacterium]|nr:monovalent cation/H(+) antiporter subunit G [Alphaproteobacteria bacterium]
MIDSVLTLVSWFFVIFGSFFYVVGAFGLIRMPELFTRMHAVSVSETVGSFFIIIAMILQSGWSLNSARLFFILIIFLFSGPFVSHALARAALFAGISPHDMEKEMVEDCTQSYPHSHVSPEEASECNQ